MKACLKYEYILSRETEDMTGWRNSYKLLNVSFQSKYVALEVVSAGVVGAWVQ